MLCRLIVLIGLFGKVHGPQSPALQEIRGNYAGLLNSYLTFADYKPLPPTRATPVFLSDFPEGSLLTFEQLQHAAAPKDPAEAKALAEFIQQVANQRRILATVAHATNDNKIVVDYLYYNVKPQDFGRDVLSAAAFEEPKPDSVVAATLVDSVESPKFKKAPDTPPWLAMIIHDEYEKILTLGKAIYPNLRNRHFVFEISEAPQHNEPLWAETNGRTVYLSPRYARAVFILALKSDHYLVTSYNYHVHQENGKPNDLLDPNSSWNNPSPNVFMAQHDIGTGCANVEVNIRQLLDFTLAHELMHIALAAPGADIAPDEIAADDNAADLLTSNGRKPAIQAYRDFVQSVFDSQELKYFNLQTSDAQKAAKNRLDRLAGN